MRKGFFLAIVLFMTACGERSSTLSLELGYADANQLRALRLGIVPDNWEGSADSVEAWTRRYGGKVLSRERKEERRITLELRIPVPQADSFITKVKDMGYLFAEEVERTALSQSVSSIDSLIRLKEEVIARYRDLLQKARTANEIQEIEQVLSTTIQERDSLMKLLEGLRMESGTVAILIQLVNKRFAGMGAGGSFWSQFGRGLVEGWDLFKYFLIGIAYLWWLWVGLALLIWLLIRYSRRSSVTKRSSPPPPPGPST